MFKFKSQKLNVLIALLFATLSVQAVEFVQTEQFITPEGEALAKETWVSAQMISINGEASNDLFAVASEIDLNGTFHGDVWGCGDHVSAAGIFRNDARLAGRTTEVSGTLHGALSAIGHTVKVERTADIDTIEFTTSGSQRMEISPNPDTRNFYL